MRDTVIRGDMTIRELVPQKGYTRLVEAKDSETGLHAIVSIHSLQRGPAAGGCRMFNYPNVRDAIEDVERLSRGMTYKNAAADLPLGGGKAVIIGDPVTDKTPALMRSFGRFINHFAGDYYTAEDVGMSPGDLEISATETRYVAGLESGRFASGDPSPVTARGVFQCMRETLKYASGSDSLAGKTVAIQGLGHVGMHLAKMLHEAGATLTVADIYEGAVQKAVDEFGATSVPSGHILEQEADILALCALGGALSLDNIPRLKCSYIVGAANNQLATSACGQQLKNAGILYAPDYIVNGGGIINVAMEILKINDESYRENRIEGLARTLTEVLQMAHKTGEPPHIVADRLIESRFA